MFGHQTPVTPETGPDARGRSGLRYAISHNPWIPIMIAALAWGSAPAASRSILLRGVSPFTIFPLKQVVGTVVIIGALALMGRNLRMDRQTLLAGAIIGVFNMTIPTILFTLGFQVIPASIGAVIVGVIPLTTILLTHWVVPSERFRIARVPGLVMAVGGIGVMSWAPIGQPSSRWVLGVVLMTVGSVSAGLAGALTRRYAVRHRNAPLITSQYLTSALILSLLSIPFGGYEGYSTIDATGLWADHLYGNRSHRHFFHRLHVGFADHHRRPGGSDRISVASGGSDAGSGVAVRAHHPAIDPGNPGGGHRDCDQRPARSTGQPSPGRPPGRLPVNWPR